MVHLYHAYPTGVEDGPATMQKHLLWDRKAEGGFPGMFISFHLPTSPTSSKNLSSLTLLTDREGPYELELEQSSIKSRHCLNGTPPQIWGSVSSHALQPPTPTTTRLTPNSSETKELKRRVRDIIDPSRNLGHVDGHKSKSLPLTPVSIPIPHQLLNTSFPIHITLSTFPSSLHLPKPYSSYHSSLKLRLTNLLESQPEASQSPSTSELPTTQAIPPAINRLQAENLGERKFTPMDVDVASRRASEVGGNEKIKIGEGEGFFCRPGDEDCG